MSVKVSLNKSAILKRIKNGTNSARALTTESVKKYSDPYTPRDKSTLIDTALVNEKEGTITYTQPYSKRLWLGVDYNFSKDKNPQATFKWCEKAVSDHKKELDKIAQNSFTKGMK